MPDVEQLRHLSAEVRPPAFEGLERIAERRDRRASASVALASLAAVATIAIAGLLVANAGDGRPDPAPFIPTPTPSPSTPQPTESPREKTAHTSATSMTLEEVVHAEDATLELTGVSVDDPNFRVSTWLATCHWCPRGEVGRPTFTALAITRDGYATTTYRHAPFDTGLERIESPAPGLLMVVDRANGYEWLIRPDGTITEMQHDLDDVPATDTRPRFVCLGSTGHTDAGGAIPQDARLTWCVLDPDAGKIHLQHGPWDGTDFADGIRPSVVSPGSTEPVWGFQDQVDDHLIAWWLSDGTRHYRDLGPSVENGAVLNAPSGTMAYWLWRGGDDALTVFTSDDAGSTWQTTHVGVSFRPSGDYFGLAYTPGGDLVGRQDHLLYRPSRTSASEGQRIWRADLEDGGVFAMVYEATFGAERSLGYPAFTFHDDQIWTSRLWSDDDGRTWSEVGVWR
jgi:hypothetical protein